MVSQVCRPQFSQTPNKEKIPKIHHLSIPCPPFSKQQNRSLIPQSNHQKKEKKKGKSKSSDETEPNGAGMKENLELMNSRNDQSQIKKA